MLDLITEYVRLVLFSPSDPFWDDYVLVLDALTMITSLGILFFLFYFVLNLVLSGVRFFTGFGGNYKI